MNTIGPPSRHHADRVLPRRFRASQGGPLLEIPAFLQASPPSPCAPSSHAVASTTTTTTITTTTPKPIGYDFPHSGSCSPLTLLPRKPFPLMSLPTELRRQIFAIFATAEGGERSLPQTGGKLLVPMQYFAPILWVSRQVRDEVVAVLCTSGSAYVMSSTCATTIPSAVLGTILQADVVMRVRFDHALTTPKPNTLPLIPRTKAPRTWHHVECPPPPLKSWRQTATCFQEALVLAKRSTVQARIELDVSRCICSCYRMESWVSQWMTVWNPASEALFDRGIAICHQYYVPDPVNRLDEEAAPNYAEIW